MGINCVYIIKDKQSDRFYVGSTNDILSRMNRHLNELTRKIHHNKNLQDLWDSGARFETTAYAKKTIQEARDEELRIITENKDNPSMLNISLGTNGGDNLTKNPNRDLIIDKMTKTIRKIASELSPEELKKKHGRPGKLNGMYGKTHTPEARAIISHANKTREHRRGFKLSDEQKQLLSKLAKEKTGKKNPFFGKHHTEETKRKIREQNEMSRLKEGYIAPNSRPVIVDGVTYKSSSDASKKLGIERSLFGHRLRSSLEKYSNYKYVDKCPTTIETATNVERE
jgi:group I intron endonuclease